LQAVGLHGDRLAIKPVQNGFLRNATADDTAGPPVLYNNAAFYDGAQYWRFDASAIITGDKLTEGKTYVLTPVAKDQPGNQTGQSGPGDSDPDGGTPVAFTWDKTPPATAVASHANGSKIGPAQAWFCATSADAVAGVNRVEYAIQRISDGQWWNGGADASQPSAWGAEPGDRPDAAFNGPNCPANQYAFQGPAFPGLHGLQYRIIFRGCDAAGGTANTDCDASAKDANYNGMAGYALAEGVEFSTVTVDAQSPTSSVSSPADGTDQKLVTLLSGAASDAATGNSGLGSVKVQISSKTGLGNACDGSQGTPVDGTCKYWDGSVWIDPAGGAPPAASFLATDPPGNAVNWTYTVGGGLAFMNDRTFRVVARAADTKGNEANGTPMTFYFDTAAPAASVASVPAGAYRRSLTSAAGISCTKCVVGEASDTGSGSIASGAGGGTQLAFYSASTTKYWKPADGDFTSTPLVWLNSNYNGVQYWSYDATAIVDAAKLVEGNSYQLTPISQDRAGNRTGQASPSESANAPGGATVTFTWDQTPPVTAVVSQGHNTTIGAGRTWFCAMSADALQGAAGVDRVEYAIQKVTGGDYWQDWSGHAEPDASQASAWAAGEPDGGNWPDTAYNGPNCPANQYAFQGPTFPGLHGQQFRVIFRGCDKAGNTANTNCAAAAKDVNYNGMTGFPLADGQERITVTVDAQTPTSSVSSPADTSFKNAPPVVTGAASDAASGNSGLSAVTLLIAYRTDAGTLSECDASPVDANCRYWTGAWTGPSGVNLPAGAWRPSDAPGNA
ncbi:MAG: hypothetical protein HY608_04730, partial [Planctomycetes bacterium]|nr:hypothetical protein [Planctomycetota bacterium]